MQLFKTILKADTIRDIPYSFYEYVWASYEEFREGKDQYGRELKMITNAKFLMEDEGIVGLLAEAIHKRRSKM